MKLTCVCGRIRLKLYFRTTGQFLLAPNAFYSHFGAKISAILFWKCQLQHISQHFWFMSPFWKLIVCCGVLRHTTFSVLTFVNIKPISLCCTIFIFTLLWLTLNAKHFRTFTPPKMSFRTQFYLDTLDYGERVYISLLSHISEVWSHSLQNFASWRATCLLSLYLHAFVLPIINVSVFLDLLHQMPMCNYKNPNSN